MTFSVGDSVERCKGSYKFPGVVIGVGKKLNSDRILCMVETTVEGCEGMVHIFGESELTLTNKEN